MPVLVESRVRCEADVERVFDSVGNTDRLNRESGLPEVGIRPLEDGSSSRVVTFAVGPLDLEYVESPWEWDRPRRIHVVREYRKGPFQSIDVQFLFEPKDVGCEVHLRFESEAKPSFMAPVVRVALTSIANKLSRGIEQIDREIRGEVLEQRSPVNRVELARAEAELLDLVGSSKELARKLVGHVADAPDQEVLRIRPFELGDLWGAERRSVLETCLFGVIAGLLELSWDLICPSCRVAVARVPNLAEIESHSSCHLCDLSFGISLDEAVEATFTPQKAIRSIAERQYCTGGPGMTPHVVAQANLHAKEPVELAVPTEIGRYRLFLRGGATAPVEVAPEHAERMSAAVVAGDHGLVINPERVLVRPLGRIRLEPAVDVSGQHVKLERMEWATAGASAHFVSTLPAFRRMFSEDLLRPNLAIRVTRAALLFSDLSASTALYTRAGDAKAFGLVQDHFELLRVEIEANQGTIVKTIGDAVMASFADEGGALRAAIGMQRAFPKFRAEHVESADVFLKIGVFAGPCYAVSANGVLDYFGQTVNVAARLQGQAHDAEIVVTAGEAERAKEAGLLNGLLVDPPFVAKLKGVEPDILAVRIRLT